MYLVNCRSINVSLLAEKLARCDRDRNRVVLILSAGKLARCDRDRNGVVLILSAEN